MNVFDSFKITNETVVITGGAGLLGREHAKAVLEAEGNAILLDISDDALHCAISDLKELYPDKKKNVIGYKVDITNRDEVEHIQTMILDRFGSIDVLINNAANNPKMEKVSDNMGAIQFENFPLSIWNDDISVGLTGAFLCSQVFGAVMAKQGKGVILNISSDLGVIAPDQRIYRKEGLKEEEQTVKPVTYSIIKHGLIGLTKYLATYYAEKGVRCNALCPAGVYNKQDAVFLEKLTNLIPMGRMADKDEYKSTIVYLISEASKYMTGSVVIVDGGRTCW